MSAPNDGSNGSRRRQTGRNANRNITGPQSALTDFLASHNISAAEIRRSYEQRRANAHPAQGTGDATAQQQFTSATTPRTTRSSINAPSASTPAQSEAEKQAKAAGRRRASQKAAEKIKAAKKRKRDDDSDDEDFAMGRALAESSRPAPGQIDHCDICTRKFTVTPYSKSGPSGGLLCSDCSRNADKEAKKPEQKKARVYKGASRKRQIQSRIMDRTFRFGAKGLTTLCVETLAKNVHLADDLGDLPEHLVDKVAQLLSKRRLVNQTTAQLLVDPSTEALKIYDGAKLTGDDLRSCFATAQKLKSFKIYNGIQFKDDVMAYLESRNIELEHLYLHGANLLSDEAWNTFLAKKGTHLESLKVHYTDRHFGDQMIETLRAECPNLKRLALIHNQQLTQDGVKALGNLKNLEYLSLKLKNEVPNRVLRGLLGKIGSNLKTLSLRAVPRTDDDILEAIHANCKSLTKLRITESLAMTDGGFADLFNHWDNVPLEYVDFSKCRHVDSASPRQPESRIGLGDEGFRALMKHSGPKIRHLNIESARYISEETFEQVFDFHQGTEYPELRYLEIAFCETATDFIIGCIFKSCPNLKELVVFGCMNLKGQVRVPRGKLLIGVPNVMGMTIEGSDE